MANWITKFKQLSLLIVGPPLLVPRPGSPWIADSRRSVTSKTDTEQQREWLHFESNAIERLRTGSNIKKTGIGRILSLLVAPSFENAVCYDLYKGFTSHEGQRYVMIFSSWQRLKDIRKFETPIERLKYPRFIPPTIEQMEIEVKSDYTDSLLRKFKSVRVPPIIDEAVFGCDGTSYEIQFGELFHHSRFVWWEQGPKEWQHLMSIAIKFADAMQQKIISRTNDSIRTA